MPVSKPCGRYFAMFSRMRLCSPTRSSAGEALSKVGQHATGVAVGFHHEPSDDLDLLRIPRAVDHYHILRYVTHASYGVLLGPALPYGLLSAFGWECSVEAAVGHGMNVGEFPPDHERLTRASRKFLPQPQGASPRYGDGARALLHARKGEDPPGKLLHHLGLWVLLQLGVRVGGRGSGTGPAPLRQDAFVHLLFYTLPLRISRRSYEHSTKTREYTPQIPSAAP